MNFILFLLHIENAVCIGKKKKTRNDDAGTAADTTRRNGVNTRIRKINKYKNTRYPSGLLRMRSKSVRLRPGNTVRPIGRSNTTNNCNVAAKCHNSNERTSRSRTSHKTRARGRYMRQRTDRTRGVVSTKQSGGAARADTAIFSCIYLFSSTVVTERE